MSDEHLAPIGQRIALVVARIVAWLWNALRGLGVTLVTRIWQVVVDLWNVIKLCRFSALFSLAGIILLVFTDQGRDLLRDLGDSVDNARYLTHHLSLFCLSTTWAITSWYSARALLYRSSSYRDSPKESIRIRCLREWVPRFLGASNYLAIAVGAFRVQEYGIGMSYSVFALLLIALTKWRATILAKKQARPQNYLLSKKQLGLTKRVLAGFLVVLAVFFVAVVIYQVTFPQWIGAPAIFAAAAAFWVALGNLVVFAWPPLYSASALVAAAIGWVALMSLWNDNHDIRSIPTPEAATVAFSRPTLDEQFKGWVNALPEHGKKRSPRPIYLVAAEGGGIRAAYWTSSVLAKLHELHPEFSRHLFAISGVSGGSLGALVYGALLIEAHDQSKVNPGATTLSCSPSEDRSSSTSNVPKGFVRCARAVLSEDYLSPALAAMLFPDLVQRFLWFPISSWDRAKALEHAWEEGWRRHFSNSRFGEAFSELWTNERRYIAPSMFLNGTWVEAGSRVITSNVYIDTRIFSDARDFFSESSVSIPVSTAALNSARFTYISPAGLLQSAVYPESKHSNAPDSKPDGDLVSNPNVNPEGYADGVPEHWGHLVDGGYLENSGTLTASEILAFISKIARRAKLSLHVIYISNNPGALDDVVPEPSDVLSELFAPLETFWETRNGRGRLSQRSISKIVTELKEDQKLDATYIEIGLPKRKAKPPLGWFLSRSAREFMDERLQAEVVRLCAALKPLGPSPDCPRY